MGDLRTTQDFADEHALRAYIKSDRGLYERHLAQDPKFRSYVGQPLPDLYYRRAARIADAQGQDAADAFIKAELHQRFMAATEAEQRAEGLWRYRYGFVTTVIVLVSWYLLVDTLLHYRVFGH